MSKIEGLSIVILAAGQSKRLKQAKQLVQYQGHSLIERQCRLALNFSDDVYCLLGAQHDEIRKSFNQNLSAKIKFLVNNNWQLGMSSSIVEAIKILPPSCNAVMILLVDQWQLTQENVTDFISSWLAMPEKICSASTQSTMSELSYGPPVIFPKVYFEELGYLTGQKGAKQVVKDNISHATFCDFPAAFVDLDTPQQLAKLMRDS